MVFPVSDSFWKRVIALYDLRGGEERHVLKGKLESSRIPLSRIRTDYPVWQVGDFELLATKVQNANSGSNHKDSSPDQIVKWGGGYSS